MTPNWMVSNLNNSIAFLIRLYPYKCFINNPQSEQILTEGEEILSNHDPKQKSRVNGHSIFWMVAALCVFYYTDFYMALRIDPRIHR
jgi:hypothetical protein